MKVLKEGIKIVFACIIVLGVKLAPYLIMIGLLIGCMHYCDSQTTSSTTSQQDISSVYDELSEEDKRYLGNSLPTGAAPYEEVYGANYVCNRTQCSGIKVTAPRESDIVVIIKKGNSEGKVVQHGYIKAGNTYQFDVPDGRYQTFFYYGEGWNPNKEMPSGVIGGFVKDEVFSKDKPQDVYGAILTYVLQLRRDGNFQTQTSNASEAL